MSVEADGCSDLEIPDIVGLVAGRLSIKVKQKAPFADAKGAKRSSYVLGKLVFRISGHL